MRLTKKRVKELHTELWLWLAEDPKREKCYWPRWEYNGGDIPEILFDCFPCEYAHQHGDRDKYCHCPLDFPNWETTSGGGDCLNELYYKWCLMKDEKRAALAKQIAELPLR